MKKLFSLILTVIITGSVIMTSCTDNGNEERSIGSEEPSALTDESTEESLEESSEDTSSRDLAEGCPYYYEYGAEIEGDDNVSVLTNGVNETPVRLTPSLSKTGKAVFKSGDWSGNTRELELDNTKTGIYVDLGFICDIESFELVSNVTECEVFYSTDGYNYTFFAGTFGKSGSLDISAKSVLFVIPFGDGIEISGIHIYGRRENVRTLLTANASYTWQGTKTYPDENNSKLTDGITFEDAGKDALTQTRASKKDAVTGKSGVITEIDLGKECNVSEVSFGLYSTSYPERITVRYSADGEEWKDLGQSYLRTFSGKTESASRKYSVTRPDTVRARYICVYFYSPSVTTDEIYVYGCENEVKVDYEFINRKNRVSDSNAASGKEVTLDGKAEILLTDGAFYKFAPLPESGTFEFGGTETRSFRGASVTYKGKMDAWNVECGGNKVENLTVYTVDAGNIETTYLYFDPTDGENVRISFGSEDAQASEVQIYADIPQLPVVRGGFAQIFLGMSSTVSEMNDSYSWFLMLKGMRDLGMEYLVLSQAADYNAKMTLFKTGRTVNAGYNYSQVYGCTDVCEAILNAADELGIDVYMGTISGADFADPITKIDLINGVIRDSEYVIRDLYEQYGHHKSFVGYYLADEQCDHWMTSANGVKYGRMVYKAQSDLIRELDADAKIMIAPAIWRSGTYLSAGSAMYNMIKPEKEGERPVVDIVAAQDCLGRTNELYVPDAIFDEYGKYCEEWAKNVKRAGAEFWHDAEVFEQTYTYKRYNELVRSFGYEAKLSGSIIVFDIPHYLSPFPLAPYNDERQYYGRCIMREYVKYYSSFREINSK